MDLVYDRAQNMSETRRMRAVLLLQQQQLDQGSHTDKSTCHYYLSWGQSKYYRGFQWITYHTTSYNVYLELHKYVRRTARTDFSMPLFDPIIPGVHILIIVIWMHVAGKNKKRTANLLVDQFDLDPSIVANEWTRKEQIPQSTHQLDFEYTPNCHYVNLISRCDDNSGKFQPFYGILPVHMDDLNLFMRGVSSATGLVRVAFMRRGNP